ncbi:MAG: hypothetical protein ACI90V_010096, partial [Bacillariaceae sp.]
KIDGDPLSREALTKRYGRGEGKYQEKRSKLHIP